MSIRPQPSGVAQLGRTIFLVGLSLVILACDPGDSSLVEPAPPEDATSLIVRALLEPSERDVAAALGWQAGIAKLEVKVHRVDDPYDPQYWVAAVTDSDGRARFTDLPPGRYEVVTRRVLAAEEAGRTGGRVRAFADGRIVGAPSSIETELRLAGDRAGSLIFSETSLVVPLPWETGGGSYHGGKYIELYNQADTTVYLDGKILGISWNLARDYQFWPCEVSRPFREDSLGLWSRWTMQFPGTGREYAVPPGAAVLIAASATDHRAVHPTLLDLRSADFELMTGVGSADNPSAPNLRDIGPSSWNFTRPGLADPIFIAEAVDLSGLPRMRDPYSGHEYARVPAEKILDVTAARWDWTKSSGYTARPLCGASVHPVFDRLSGPPRASAVDIGPSATRRVLRLEGGRIILQDTNTSMADFVLAQPTPGWVQ